jgi:PAS domain S-box-containing protein
VLFALQVMLMPAVYYLLVAGAFAATSGLALREYRESVHGTARAFLAAAALGTVLHFLLGLYEAALAAMTSGVPHAGAVSTLARDPLAYALEAAGWIALGATVLFARLNTRPLLGALTAVYTGCALLAVVAPLQLWLWPAAAAVVLGASVGVSALGRGAAFDRATRVALLLVAAGNLLLAAGAQGYMVGRWLNVLGVLLLVPATDRRLSVERHALDDELQTVSREAARQTVSQLFLVEATRALVSSLDLTTVLRNVAESVALAVSADHAAIVLVDDQPGRVRVAARFDPLRRQRPVELPVIYALDEHPALAHALRRGQQVMLDETEDGTLRQLAALVGVSALGPAIVEPLLLHGRPLGALLVCHAPGKAPFSHEQAYFTQALGGQIAAAVENARLYHELDLRAGELSGLLRTRETEFTRRQAILESIADGVVVCDARGNVILVNAAAETLLGAGRERLVDRALDDAVRALSNAREIAVRNVMALTSDRAFTFEAELIGGARMVQGSLAVVRVAPDDMEPLGTVLVLRDVTRERQAERAKSAFVTTVSHELRTPLTAIKGYLHFLATGAAGELSALQNQFVHTIQDNSERMVTLINNMIMVTEMAGGVQLKVARVAPEPLIASAVKAFSEPATEKGLELTFQPGESLPVIEADAGRLRTVLDCLLDNAIKYTPAGGKIAVTASSEVQAEEGRQRQFLLVSVRDTGIGIPPEQQAHLFEQFYHPDTRPEEIVAGGMGMGLSIVHSLVEAHGGRVWVESRVGSGSTFTFVIPAQR